MKNYKKYLPDSLNNSNDQGKVVAALLIGAAVGAIIGVLFAPESGGDIRTRLSDKARDLSGSVKDRLRSAKDRVEAEADKLNDLKDKTVKTVKAKAGTAQENFSEPEQNA